MKSAHRRKQVPAATPLSSASATQNPLHQNPLHARRDSLDGVGNPHEAPVLARHVALDEQKVSTGIDLHSFISYARKHQREGAEGKGKRTTYMHMEMEKHGTRTPNATCCSRASLRIVHHATAGYVVILILGVKYSCWWEGCTHKRATHAGHAKPCHASVAASCCATSSFCDVAHHLQRAV